MKRLIAISGAGILLTINSALAQPYPGETWTIDENGPALLGGGAVAGFSNGKYQVDPVSGLMGWYYPLTLTPNLPGDVVLFEPNAPTGTMSDLLRFDGTGGVYFFSDLEAGDPNPDHADVPVVPQFSTNNPVVFLNEVGPEGHNGALYTPGPGQPGFDTSGIFPGIQYNFVSDVPEPGTGALLIAGILLAVSRTHRKS